VTNQPAGMTPEEAKAWRQARAQRAGRASQNPIAWADRIVKHWPDLDPGEQTIVRSTLYRVICTDPQEEQTAP
jgi:hypothetical protein